VARLQFDRHGNRAWKRAEQLLGAQRTRQAVGEVAVAFGRCSEPADVSAGGGQCPLRFRCLGCEHFSTDVSYLPELRSYLDDLLRTRERLPAMTTADDWAKREAMPSEEEITRLRRLIRRVSEDLGSLTPREQAEIHDAVTAVRKTRQAFLGIPGCASPSPTSGRSARHDRQRSRRSANDQRTPGRLRPPPGTRAQRPCRDGPQRRGRHHLRARQAGRSRPLLPLPAPGPAGPGSERGSARRPTSMASRPASSTLNSRPST
jgi:hypothetical protein